MNRKKFDHFYMARKVPTPQLYGDNRPTGGMYNTLTKEVIYLPEWSFAGRWFIMTNTKYPEYNFNF